jgi:hypothetical protein
MDSSTYQELVHFLSANNEKTRWPISIVQIQNKKKRSNKKSKFQKKASKFVVQDGKLFRKVIVKMLTDVEDSEGKYSEKMKLDI